jgi:hypothetical protein
MSEKSVVINAGTPHQVALDLAFRIDYSSSLPTASKDKAYWLKLYWDCLRVVQGGKPD